MSEKKVTVEAEEMLHDPMAAIEKQAVKYGGIVKELDPSEISPEDMKMLMGELDAGIEEAEKVLADEATKVVPVTRGTVPKSPPDVEYRSKAKLIVTGLPSSGTTCMMHLLNELGLDTGFDGDHLDTLQGMEYLAEGKGQDILKDIREDKNDHTPYVVKIPCSMQGIPFDVVDALRWKVNDIIVTVRNPEHIEQSRREKNYTAAQWPEFYRFVWECAKRNINPLFIEFPRFVTDKAYAYDMISDVSLEFADLARFSEAWDKVMDTNKITAKGVTNA
jgi:hypothetical protein